jgi:hypothetical protein
MLKAARGSRVAWVALAVAAVLSIGSSTGLHPEQPNVGRVDSSAGDGLHRARGDSAPHVCLACLTYGATVAARLGPTLVSNEGARPLVPHDRPGPPGRTAARPLSGRSPPLSS